MVEKLAEKDLQDLVFMKLSSLYLRDNLLKENTFFVYILMKIEIGYHSYAYMTCHHCFG